MRFRLLGPLCVRDGAEWRPVTAAQQRVVLTVLLAEAGRAVSTERLVGEVWGERPPRAARRTLHGYVYRLRRLLGDRTVIGRGGGYELKVAEGDLDADVFTRMVASARLARAAGDVPLAAARLEEALSLWHGQTLADVPACPTATAWTSRLDRERADATEGWLDTLLDLDRPADVVEVAERLLAEHPLREHVWGQLMTALHRLGRRVEALDTYRRVRELLRTELRVEPGPVLRGIQAEVLSGASEPGQSRLTPRQLPIDVNDFAGRQECLRRLHGLVAGEPRPTAMIALVTGRAGVGKTALAVHFGHRMAGRFPDGQLYANLRGHTGGPPARPVDMLTGFLSALGVAGDQVPTDEDNAAALYRSHLAGRRMFVLLDDASHPDQIRPLLPASPGCLVVVTSRDQLRGLIARDGAVPVPLDPLTTDEALVLLARTLGKQRVRAEIEASAELARLCGHLPLALRVAAADLSQEVRSIGDYVAELTVDPSAAREYSHG